MMIRTTNKASRWGAASAFAVFGGAMAGPAVAADNVSTPSATMEEVSVTASRIQREGFTAPTPTTVLDSELLIKSGATNIGEALSKMPAFQSDQNASTNTLGGAAGRRYANLRNLGSQRTLVLQDGQRLPPSALTGQTDLNTVPQILIDRVDVVTGGASAQWGSDAVAGVVNMVTKKRYDGFETDVSYGMSNYGDNREKRVAALYGTSFADDRAHFTIGSEWVDNEGVGNMYTRDWGREEWGLVSNAGYGTNGLPRTLTAPHVHRNVLVAAGIISTGPLAGTTFNPDGSSRPFVYGSPNGSGAMSGGEGYGLGDGVARRLSVPVERVVTQARLGFELTPDIEVFGQANYGYVHVNTWGPSAGDNAAITIRSGNPFIPDELQARMDALGLTSFGLNRFAREDIYGNGYGTSTEIDNYTRNQIYTLGVNGNTGGWTWDGYAQFARSAVKTRGTGYRINANFARSVDAVLDGNGDIVCRSTLTNPTDGCVPVNLFGLGSVTREAFEYYSGSQRTETIYDRWVVAANVSGEPFSTWAGEASVAAGVEYREDDAELIQNDPIALARGYIFGNAQPLSGSDTVREGYVETALPLLKDKPFAESLDLNAAVRETNYRNSGSVTTWKVGLTDAVNSSVRLRTSFSRDIRAPNLSELYTSVSSSNVNVINPENGANLTTRTETSGNTALTPEKAETFTAGVVLTPQAVPGLKFAVDYYDIDIEDVISSVSTQQVIDFCYAGAASFCALVTRLSEQSAIVRAPLLNLAGLKVKGYDAELGYGFDLDGLSSALAGRLDANYFLTYQPDIIVDNGSSSLNRAGDMGTASTPYGGPKLKWSGYFTYSLNELSATVGVRYVGNGVKNVMYTAQDIDDNSVKSATYVSLALGYELPAWRDTAEVQLYANVQNLFDKAPPFDPTSSEGNPYNATFHDVVGRTFMIGFRVKP